MRLSEAQKRLLEQLEADREQFASDLSAFGCVFMTPEGRVIPAKDVYKLPDPSGLKALEEG